MWLRIVIMIMCGSFLFACTPIQIDERGQVEITDTSSTPMMEVEISGTDASNSIVPTSIPLTATFTPYQAPSTVTYPPLAEPPATETPAPSTGLEGGGESSHRILIDHKSIEQFDQIPAEYIEKASQLTWLNRVASVGANISFGLDCLQNYFPDRDDPRRRPYACDRDLAPSDVIYGAQYNRSNWLFEFHSPPPNPNPGWNNKVNYFIERIDGLKPDENFQVVSFDVAYAEDPSIIEHFFTNDNPNDAFPSVLDLAALRERHPDRIFVWWTLALARMSEPHTMEFNQRMREYAAQHNLILIDIADIESHAPNGMPCTGIDRHGNPTNIPAICPEYTNERFAGHLNALGHTRMAKAVWVLMSQLAGWVPPSAP